MEIKATKRGYAVCLNGKFPTIREAKILNTYTVHLNGKLPTVQELKILNTYGEFKIVTKRQYQYLEQRVRGSLTFECPLNQKFFIIV